MAGLYRKVLRISLKLCLLVGAIEILGVVQIESTNEAAKLVDSVFEIIYQFLRSSRGVFIVAIYVIPDLRKKMRKKIEQSATTSSTIDR